MPGLATQINGRYIVQAGTIYPANDTTAIGIVVNDYDVTDGDKVMAVAIQADVYTAALPEAPSSNAIAALKESISCHLPGQISLFGILIILLALHMLLRVRMLQPRL